MQSWVAGGGTVVTRIIDNGPGIPINMRRKIFGRFFRIGSELERSKTGTGLGLFIVRTLVKRMRGKVNVRGRGAQQGSVFEVELPGREVAAAAIGGLATHSKWVSHTMATVGGRQAHPGRRGRTASGDRHQVQPRGRRLSRHAGRRRACGARAFESKRHGIDLVILDLMLPGMSGYAVCEAAAREG